MRLNLDMVRFQRGKAGLQGVKPGCRTQGAEIFILLIHEYMGRAEGSDSGFDSKYPRFILRSVNKAVGVGDKKMLGGEVRSA